MPRTSGYWVTSIACILLAAAPSAGSQDAKTLARFDSGPFSVSAGQAVVGIEVTNTSADGASRQTRRGNGCILRCDGYILAPQSLFSYRIDARGEDGADQTIVVTLDPGQPAARRVTARRPRFFGKIPVAGLLSKHLPLGYVAIKLDNVLAPALRTLRPEPLKPPDSIRLFWTPWDSGQQRFGTLQSREVRLAAADRYAKESPPGTLYLAEKQEGVPLGAVAEGPEGFGVGLVDGDSETAPRDALADFSELEYATNCVTPFPTLDSQFAKSAASAAEPSDAAPAPEAEAEGMVRVTGGPVRLPDAVRSLQPELGTATTAWVAPFQIDKVAVTNADYLAFWQSLPARDRARDAFRLAFYPAGWADIDPPFPAEIANVPVLGVRLPGAEAYARRRGKRLPTPAEWCRAALGAKGDAACPEWVIRYLADRTQTWRNIVLAHALYLRAHPDMTIDPDRAGRVRPYTIPYRILPWFFGAADLLEASQWSQQEIEREMAHLWTTWKDPVYVLPVGSREFDVSPFGVHDVILNGGELVQPMPNWADRQDLPNTTPNYYMELYFTDIALRQNGPPADMPLIGGWSEFYPRFSPQPQPEMQVLPMLSRLVKPPPLGAGTGFEYNYGTMLGSAFYEVDELMRPVSDWVVRLIPGPFQERFLGMNTFYGWPQNHWITGSGDITTPAHFSAAYALWSGAPRHFHREIGRTTPLGDSRERNAIFPSESPMSAGTYIVPGGFRCVR